MTNQPQHTPEPWRELPSHGVDAVIPKPVDTLTRVEMSFTDYARARACVNACADWPDPQDMRDAADEALTLQEACAGIENPEETIPALVAAMERLLEPEWCPSCRADTADSTCGKCGDELSDCDDRWGKARDLIAKCKGVK